MELKPNKAVCFDFDGVIHKYSKGWQDGSIYDIENGDILSFIQILMKNKIPCFVCSTRDSWQIEQWWNENIVIHYGIQCIQIPEYMKFWNKTDKIGITNRKLAAQVYIDDRAFNYSGQSYRDLLSTFNIMDDNNKLF